MNRILNAIKCSICNEIISGPVILPCNDIVCNIHISNRIGDFIRCEKCGVEHRIPSNGFQPVFALQEIIEAEIANIDLGSAHKEAKKSYESVEDSIEKFEMLLKDPYVYIYERINELKNNVQLKGEELKLRIYTELKKFFDRLKEYESQFKDYISSNEFKEESQKLDSELKLARSNLDSWFESLNK